MTKREKSMTMVEKKLWINMNNNKIKEEDNKVEILEDLIFLIFSVVEEVVVNRVDSSLVSEEEEEDLKIWVHFLVVVEDNKEDKDRDFKMITILQKVKKLK